MSFSYQDIIKLLVSYPGNMTYHLVLTFSLAGVLQASLISWRHAAKTRIKRILLGSALLLISRIDLFLIAAATLQDVHNTTSIIPVVDRFVTAISAIVIVWLWLFPFPSKFGDTGAIVLSVFTVTLFVLSTIWWHAQPEQTYFNATWMSKGWDGFSALVLGTGLILLFIRQPEGWSTASGMISLLLIGHILQFIFPYPADKNFPGILRLTELAAYPLMLALPSNSAGENRRELDFLTSVSSRVPEQIRQWISPEFLKDIYRLPSIEEKELPRSLAKIIAQMMLADYTLISRVGNDENVIDIPCAYDIIREKFLEPEAIAHDQAPELYQAIQEGRSLRLNADDYHPDLKALCNVLHLPGNANLLSVPLRSSQNEILFNVLLLSPFSSHRWDDTDQSFLESTGKILVKFIESKRDYPSSNDTLAEEKYRLMENRLDAAMEKNKSLQTRLQGLVRILQHRREKEQPTTEVSVSVPAMQKTINHLTQQNLSLSHQVRELKTRNGKQTAQSTQPQENKPQRTEKKASIESVPTTIKKQPMSVSASASARNPITSTGNLIRSLQKTTRLISQSALFLLDSSANSLSLTTFQRQALDQIQTLSLHMQNTLHKLSANEKETRQFASIPHKMLPVRRLLRDAVLPLQNKLTQKKIRLITDIPANLAPIVGDTDAITRVSPNSHNGCRNGNSAGVYTVCFHAETPGRYRHRRPG